MATIPQIDASFVGLLRQPKGADGGRERQHANNREIDRWHDYVPQTRRPARCMLAAACRSYFCEYIVLGVIPSYAIPSSRVLGVGSAVARLLAAETERAVVRYSHGGFVFTARRPNE